MIFRLILYPTTLIVLMLLSASTLASSSSPKKTDLIVSIGNFAEYIGRFQTDDKGTSNSITFNPYIKTSLEFSTNYSNLFITPEVGLIFPKNNEDSMVSRLDFFGIMNGVYRFSNFRTKLGVGLFFSRISGDGGEETLNNGNGTTDFPRPDKAIFARNTIINLGLEYSFYKNTFIELHAFVFNLMAKEDRAFSVGLNINHHFGELFED